MNFEWYQRDVKKVVLLGISLHEKKSVYLWLSPASATKPRYYVVPWI